MATKTTNVSPAVIRLLESNKEVIFAKDIAPILEMNEGRIREYAKTGQWPSERYGNFIRSGKRIKFLRIDFLRKNGLIK